MIEVRRPLTKYEATLLDGWEEVFKKSQLTLWLLLALKHGTKPVAEIEQFIIKTTNGTIQADQQSIYRALRRLNDADVLSFSLAPSGNGPDRKIYALTDGGRRLLYEFLKRNIIEVFYKRDVISLIKGEK